MSIFLLSMEHSWQASQRERPNQASIIPSPKRLRQWLWAEQQVASAPHRQCSLPINDRAHTLPGSPPMVATPLFARYSELMTRIYERMGWKPADFSGVRLQTKYPPMGTNVSLRFELPKRP